MDIIFETTIKKLGDFYLLNDELVQGPKKCCNCDDLWKPHVLDCQCYREANYLNKRYELFYENNRFSQSTKAIHRQIVSRAFRMSYDYVIKNVDDSRPLSRSTDVEFKFD